MGSKIRGKKRKITAEKLSARFNSAKAIVAQILMLLVFVVQPLMIGAESYRNITATKYYTYVVIISFAAVLFVTVSAVQAEQAIQSKKWKPRLNPESLRGVLRAVRPYEWALLAYWFIMLISASLSDNPYAAFVMSASSRRSESFFFVTGYLFSVFLIGRFYRPKQRGLLIMCATAALISLYGICQYYGNDFLMLNVIRMREAPGPGLIFISTMSNRNMLSTYLCIAFCVCAVMFSQLRPAGKKFIHSVPSLIYLVFGFIIFYMMILGQTESGYVGVLVALAAVFPFAAKDSRSAARLLMMLAGCAYLLWVSIRIHAAFPLWQPTPWAAFEVWLIPLAAVLAVLALVLLFMPLPRLKAKTFRIAWYSAIAAVMIAIVIAIPMIAQVSGHKTIHAANEILQGNLDDSLGSHRMFIWRRAITLVPQRPIIGYGPDNFVIVFNEHFREEGLEKTNQAYDKAHSEYIQQLVDNGILGLAALLAFYGISFWGLRKKLDNPMAAALLLGMTAFLVQAFFNFSTPFAHPVVWVLWGIINAVGTQKDIGKTGGLL